MRETTFAGKVRNLASTLERGTTFSAVDLAEWLGVRTRDDVNRVRVAVRDSVRRGEMEQVEAGVYRYAHQKKEKLSRRQVMWRYLRMKKRLGVEDLQEVAGVSREYALEWLRAMVNMGVVERLEVNGCAVFRLIKDSVEMPVSEAKADYLREYREKRKTALAALGRAKAAVDAAIEAVALMDAEEDVNEDLRKDREKGGV